MYQNKTPMRTFVERKHQGYGARLCQALYTQIKNIIITFFILHIFITFYGRNFQYANRCRSRNIHKYFILEAPERVPFALFAYRPRTQTGNLFNSLKKLQSCVFPAVHRKYLARKYNLLGFRKLGNTLKVFVFLGNYRTFKLLSSPTYNTVVSLYWFYEWF